MNAEKINCMRTLIKGAISNLWADAAGREETHREVDKVCDLALKALTSRPEAQARICYMPCKAHEGMTFEITLSAWSVPAIQVCPICNPPITKEK